MTKDTGAAGHVIIEALFVNVKLEHHGDPKTCVASNEDRIRDVEEKTIPIKTTEGIRRSIQHKSASVVNFLISMRKVVQAASVVVLDEGNPHFRNARDGRTLKPDVNNGVCTLDTWVCLCKTGSVFQPTGAVSGICAMSKLVRPGKLC